MPEQGSQSLVLPHKKHITNVDSGASKHTGMQEREGVIKDENGLENRNMKGRPKKHIKTEW